MAYYFIFPEKDTTIYSHPDRLELNSGLDEIIEIVKEKGTTNEILYPSRVLIQFKDSEIESVIKDIIAPSNKSTTATSIFDETIIPNLGNFSCSLQMFSAEHKNLPSSTQLECYALAESWNEGTGRYSNLPTSSNGCSWAYKNNNTDKTSWRSGSTDKPLDPDDYPDWSPSVEFDYIDGTTGSISQNTGIPSAHNTVIGIKPGGGSWYSGSEAEGFSAEQTFTRTNILDTDFDVTSLVQKFSASLFNDLSFVPASMAQAEDRAFRIGQKNNVSCLYPIFDNTVERIIYNIVEKKKRIIDTVMGDNISEEDMFGEILQEMRSL